MPEQISKAQQKYFEEFEKYKNVELHVGKIYHHKEGPNMKYIILSVDVEKNSATIQRVLKEGEGMISSKTAHWCRKNLIEE